MKQSKENFQKRLYVRHPSSQRGQRILEFQYKIPGRYMFHAHVTEFTDLGWMGFFDVRDS